MATASPARSTGVPPAPGRGLLGPRRPRHRVDLGAASATLPLGDDGLPLGVDPTGEPVRCGLFRDGPLDLVVLGGRWLTQVLILRAVALGARVVVETGRPRDWHGLDRAAVSVQSVGRLGEQDASAARPVLVVLDRGARPGRHRPAALPWQITLTLLPFLAPDAEHLPAGADLVALQRLSPAEAAAAGCALGLPAADVQALPRLGEDQALWDAGGHRCLVRTVATATERQLLGPARRLD
ncbi:hypothetical protein ACIGXM_35150 [Kitasatospora sp. NPDC052896]|uniref:hypothetical protein n=1 Tax=Kitasatospora sp. NPDC052896 TaxID=3364061 RepID=UPI0037C85A99